MVLMDVDIYQFHNYKDIIRHAVYQGESHGGISKISKICGCQRSYLSRVLSGKIQLTPDHMFQFCNFFSFNSDERDFIMLLLEKERATTKEFENHLVSEIKKIQKEQTLIRNRLQQKRSLEFDDFESKSRYYSHWFYSAIHIAVSIPHLQSVQNLSRHLNISTFLVEEALAWLVENGFVEKVNQKFKWKSGNIHIDHNHPFTPINHLNWRLRAINDIEAANKGSLHYSVVQSLSLSDFEVVKRILTDGISRVDKVASPSNPEILVALNMSLFEINKSI